MFRSGVLYVFILVMVTGVTALVPVFGQDRRIPDSTRHKKSILDSLFDGLEAVDSLRFKMDSFVTDAINNYYKIPGSEILIERHDNDTLQKYKKALDTLIHHLPDGVHDSLKIELLDYQNSLGNFILACDGISDDSGRTGEANMRSYEDARFRLLFAKSSVLRAMNSYQTLINEQLIEEKADTIHHNIDSEFRKMKVLFRYTDSLISIPDTFRNILTASYISNELFGVGWLYLPGNRVMAVGGDLYYQLGTLHNGVNGRPTYTGVGADAEFGLSYLHFLFVGGPTILQVARPEDNNNLTYRPVTMLSWYGGMFYHYRRIGMGFVYSPLYGAGVRVQFWL